MREFNRRSIIYSCHNMNIKYLIIPDIHGRTFWRKPIEKFNDKVEHIIFLGDYFDPYPNEKITESDAIDNWHEIMNFIADHELWDKTTMLIGNHDAHYMSSIFAKLGGSSRKSKEHVDEIKSLLTGCHLLQIAYEGRVGDKEILFTHAGVTESWYLRHKDLIGKLCAKNLNHLTDTEVGWRALAEIGLSRMGNYKTGSPLWADAGEHVIFSWSTESQGEFDFQVFGHTQFDHPVIEKSFAMLDCQRCFAMTDEAKLLAIKNF